MKLKKLLGLLLLAACLALVGCTGDTPEVTEAPVSDVEKEEVPDICIFENGEGIYQFVRPYECSWEVVESASMGWRFMRDQYDTEVGIISDFAKKPEDIPTGTLEILIGQTNRPESAEIAETLGESEYRITCVGERIVIAAADDCMLRPAMEAFAAAVEVDENGRGTIPGDLDLVFDYSDTPRPDWFADDVPSCNSGVISKNMASETLGFDAQNARTKVLCISEITAEEFEDYIEKVRGEGFDVRQRADRDAVLAYQCDKDGISFYTYHTDGTEEARFILEKSDSVSLEEFNYTTESQDGVTNDLYMFGVMMDPNGTSDTVNGNTRLNCGQMFFIKLSDNSLVVIDGGGAHQMSNSAAEEFLRLARETTGVPEGEKVRISCWFITHAHGDHFKGFNRFITRYHDHIEIERILYNVKESTSAFNHMIRTVNRYYPDILYHKPHTGETIQLADISMDVMYTLEDQMDPVKMEYMSDDFNDTCTVMRVNFDGTTFMILGDINSVAEMRMTKYYTEDMLKSDIMQVAHHGLNYLPSLYKAIDARIALYPQSSGGAEKIWSGDGAKILANVRENCDELYFGGDETVGVRVIDGEAEVFCHYPVVGSDYTGWSWY